MYNTGARVSEAIGLRVGEVVVDGSAVAHLHGKGRKDRSVPLWRTTANLIRNWKRRLDCAGEENFLFPNRGGGRMARSDVTQRLELAVSAAAERYPQLARRSISPHTNRLFFGTGAHLRGERCTPFAKSTIAVLRNSLNEPQRGDQSILFPSARGRGTQWPWTSCRRA